MGQTLSSKLLFIYSQTVIDFSLFHISHGSVATECASEKILRIGRYLTKIGL